ncbi:MAG TPA: glutathione S-transferase [Brevundimonas sp.]|jgi:glutathione S-transferase|uniref:glutathione S-transferase family protein n=1 Tax=Brevundimonas sp. TaxID=1871086 RepID=UPI002BE1D8F7|nr:glutathione S-transferase [Brevundimonas sp.]HRH19666.1 glutathione S-transferase [Brevundimonas sp.]
MKLYDTLMAPNPRRVRWIMAEKGIEDIEIVQVNLLAGEHRTAAYRDRAGLAHLPALELDDGTTITESLAIGRFLESLYPEPNLFGRDATEAAVIEMWTRRMELYLANPMMMFTRFTHPALSALEPPEPAVGAYNLNTAEKMMKSLNRRLEGRAFIAADRITAADIVAYVGLDFGRLVKYRPDGSLENLGRWREAMKARPAAEAGLRA